MERSKNSPKPAGAQFELGQLLPSQAIFVFAPTWLVAYAGGWGTGKTVALCTRILKYVASEPFSRAAILRLHASDLRDTTLPIWDEVVPASWVKRRVRTKGNEYDLLKNNSTVVFRHIHDSVKGRTHLGSLNVAHIGVDQAEEITEDDFLKLLPRARYRKELYHSLAFTFNPAGHNWLWRRLYQNMKVMRGHPLKQLDKWDWMFTGPQSLALAVPTLENTPQCGGYLPEGFYENLRREYPPEWTARYLDCSFDDFQGKVYPRYSLDSDHNLDYWAPNPNEEYAFGIGIDVGGSAPWCLLRVARDKLGRVIAYDELYKSNLAIREVARWIQSDPNWQKAQDSGLIVIDPENKVAATELQQFGITCSIARKDKTANILRVNTFLQPSVNTTHPVTKLPGAPRLYFTKACSQTRREHDIRLYMENGKADGAQDHSCDALEYVLERLPAPDPMKPKTRLDKLAETDPSSAHFWRTIKKKEQYDREHSLEPVDEMWGLPDELFEDDAGSKRPSEIFSGWE